MYITRTWEGGMEIHTILITRKILFTVRQLIQYNNMYIGKYVDVSKIGSWRIQNRAVIKLYLKTYYG